MSDEGNETRTSMNSLFICERGIGKDADLYPYRVADIDRSGRRLIPFTPRRGEPYAFENRNRLMPFHREGRGVVFCANWKTTQNDTDPTKDYVLPHLETLPLLVHGVCDLLSQFSVKEISLKLKKGVPDQRVLEHPVFFISLAHPGARLAVLCTPENIQMAPGGRIELKDNVYSLPYYNLPASPLKLAAYDGTYLYYPTYGELGLPNAGQCPTTARYDQVRNYIRANVLSKANLKDAGASRNETQRFREIFEALKPKLDVADLAAALSCSVGEARTELGAICRDVDQIATPGEIEDSFVNGLIDSSGALSRHFMAVWEKSHAADLVAAESERDTRIQKCKQDVAAAEAERDRELSDIKALLAKKHEDAEKVLERIDADVARKGADLARVSSELSASQQILDGVRNETKMLLGQTHEAVAKALVTAQIVKAVSAVQPSASESAEEKPSAISAAKSGAPVFLKGILLTTDQLEDDSEWNLLQENLEECGVSPGLGPALAAFLLSAYRLRKPVLLAGPSARAIADALSCVINAATADELRCEGSFDEEALSEAFAESGGVLVVRGGMNSAWTEGLLERMGTTSRMPVFPLSLSDDLAMMPRGILDYAVVIDTQPIVLAPARNYRPGLFGRTTHLPMEKEGSGRVPDETVLRKVLRCSPACESNLRHVCGLASSYLGNSDLPTAFMYSALYYSMARVLDAMQAFCVHLNSHKGVAPALLRFIAEEEA